MHIRFEITQFIDVNSVKLGDVFLLYFILFIYFFFCRKRVLVL